MSDIVIRGFELALLGMGTVFVFLTLLVLTTMAMSAGLARFAPPEVATGPQDTGASGPDARTMAAIGAAVRRYRAEHGR